MQNKLFLKAADICELLEVKQTSAYEIIGNLNKEVEEQGYLTLRGKVPTKYFVKRFYGVEDIAELFGLSVSFAYRVVERNEGRADERVTSTEANAVVKDAGKTDRKMAQQKQTVDGKDKKLSIHERLEINKKIIQEKQGKDKPERGADRGVM